MKSLMFSIILVSSFGLGKTTPDWSKEASIKLGENRKNIYQIDGDQLDQIKMIGYTHAMTYPITVTGVLIPYDSLSEFFSLSPDHLIKQYLLQSNSPLSSLSAEEEFYKWLGLSKHNGPDAQGIYKMPYPNGGPDHFYAGAGLVKTKNGKGLTFSCFACHATSLFGTTVMGLTNKRPHANLLFEIARAVIPNVNESMYQKATHANENDMKIFSRTKKNIAAVDGVVPQVHGLDTSLAHVTLSLARRNPDAYATKNAYYEKYPRYTELSHFVADSKPMPWWNLKYKTRWLSDGSVISGNPIFTNFLWNEIGRGTDLKELEDWMKNNSQIVEELTTAVFATEAPRYTDFFSVDSIDIESAKRGEKLFNQSCSRCHGIYEKAWSGSSRLINSGFSNSGSGKDGNRKNGFINNGVNKNSQSLSKIELLETTKVVYHEKTPVIDVGTDPQRYQATRYFANIFNNLAISKWMKTVIEPQKGYVPPPLVGVWSRYPYFHNGSIPNLCVLLSVESERPTDFFMGPAENKETDFDQQCVGYPVGAKIPQKWRTDFEAYMNTKRPGLRNSGHTKMLLDSNGNEKFSSMDKGDLIEFLKTL